MEKNHTPMPDSILYTVCYVRDGKLYDYQVTYSGEKIHDPAAAKRVADYMEGLAQTSTDPAASDCKKLFVEPIQ